MSRTVMVISMVSLYYKPTDLICSMVDICIGARDIIVVKALCYKLEVRGFETR
jgi:hypothetical protein